MSNTNKIIPEAELKTITKILIIQYKPFGDILLNTGYFPFLRAKFPNAQIDFLIRDSHITVLEDNPYLDNLVITHNKKGLAYYQERLRIIRVVRARKYDLIIDQMRGTGSALITLFSGAKYRIGWQLKRWNFVYNYRKPRSNDRYYSLMKFHLLEPLGISETPHELYYFIKEQSQQKIDAWLAAVNLKPKEFIVFSPGTPVLAKKWALDSFVALADLIQQNHPYQIVLLWGPGEETDCQYIAENTKYPVVIAPPTNFNEAAALLNRAFMYISQDGGINHLAVAVNTPSIAIFGPHSNPKKWQAWHLPIHPYLRNYKCMDEKDRTLGITPVMVYEKFLELLKVVDREQ
ncbi:MAG TPA: glycosyltransferase family 9 protein [Candidatus Cloacimonadota bacterium]|nr:glycosyltransferase family 9 protein [Candidatus Cloacimonadota bacterium]HQL14221.1 glycosyltransferase family 9 protein [Candidatus Cloacimonadota bacterium]